MELICKKQNWRYSLEPVLFLGYLTFSILNGAEVQTNLLIWKVCHLELGYNETVCNNLSNDTNEDIENEVQIMTNDFQLTEKILNAIPGIVAAVFAGGLSDKYGRKPLVFITLFGAWISIILRIVNYAFIRELPLQFFYLENFYFYFGGFGVYYMGVYGYGSDISSDKNRATTLARFDGTEVLGKILGTVLSSHIFKAGGNYTSYGCQLALGTICLLYLAFVIKEPKKRSESESEEKRNQTFCMEKIKSFLEKYLILPVKEFIATVSKPRVGNLRAYIYILLAIYGSFWVAVPYFFQLYLFMLKAFPGFDGTQASYFYTYVDVIGAISLLALIPFLQKVLNWHDASVGLAVHFSVTLGLFLSPFMKNLFPDFYLARFLTSFDICQYSLARSLLTKCVGKNEVGKVFAVVALLSAVTPLIMTPAIKKMYNATLTTFPGAFLLFVAGIYLASAFLYVFIWFKRKEIFDRDVESTSSLEMQFSAK